MKEFKGTKGKWKLSNSPWFNEELNTHSGGFDIRSMGKKVVEVNAYSFWGLTFEEAKANALLISKAPDMLEAIEEMQKLCDLMRFPTEEELGNMNLKLKKLIKEATEL